MNPIFDFDASWALVPLLFLVVNIIVAVLVISLLVWVLYTIIWRGVRRGLVEFELASSHHESAVVNTKFASWNPPDEPSSPDADGHLSQGRKHRSWRLTR